MAIVIAGLVARKIADEYGISGQGTASLLDIFTSAWQGVISYGAQFLYATAIGLAATSFEIIPFPCHPYLLAACALIFIALCQK